MRHSQGSESDSPAILREAARALGVSPTPPPLPDPSDSGLYMDFFGQTLDFAVSPHKPRHALAIGSGINSKTRSWIREKICVDRPDAEWLHRPLADQLVMLFAQVFEKIGNCRLSIKIGPTLASQLFACWNAPRDLRIGTHRGVLAWNDLASPECNSRTCSLEHGKSRRRMGSDDLPRDAEGNVTNEPSDDESLPPVSEALLLS